MSNPLVTTLLAELDEDALGALAQRLVPYLPAVVVDGSASDGWIDSAEAAHHLGISRDSLHKLTAARAIPFEQEGAGCKCWFKRSELDAWRRAGSAG